MSYYKKKMETTSIAAIGSRKREFAFLIAIHHTLSKIFGRFQFDVTAYNYSGAGNHKSGFMLLLRGVAYSVTNLIHRLIGKTPTIQHQMDSLVLIPVSFGGE
jgi:hypothetical protein